MSDNSGVVEVKLKELAVLTTLMAACATSQEDAKPKVDFVPVG